MRNKATPVITHTEILARAIRSVIADIEEWHSKCDGFPQPQKDIAIDHATKELREKLDTLKTLYRVETGVDYD